MRTHLLEYRLLYSMVVAGKSATFAEAVMHRLFRYGSPFEMVRHWHRIQDLEQQLRRARAGNYTKLTKGFAAIAAAGLDLRRCTPQDLERIHGIGPKTSRFFILWTRPGARLAALDTHVLKWLRYLGHEAPVATPSDGRLYAKLEAIMLEEADARKMTPRELDAKIWQWAAIDRPNPGFAFWPPDLQRRS